ncbi:imelysin family protein [Bacterioplanoides sp.]|uniref:imelysin family protein n=1 Tax=Bacterioplanoides sp. TaxID=2066072 RepID=UPI003B00E58B
MSVKLWTSIAASTLLVACGGGGGGGSSSGGTANDACSGLNSASFNCATSLRSVVDNAVKPAVNNLQGLVGTLNTTTQAYCADITNDANKTAAQNAWKAAMAEWQKLEVMQFGPIAEQRSNFYNWNRNDSCKVDEEVVNSTANGYQLTNNVEPVRFSLDALDYLLFTGSSNVSCPEVNKTAALRTWDAQDEATRLAERCNYTQLATAHMVNNVAALKTAVDNYDIGTSANLQTAADGISDGLFYIDKQTKDAKLTAVFPTSNAGIFTLSALEFDARNPYGKEAIQANLEGALALMDNGLDDYLTAAGEPEVAARMKASLQTAIDATAAISGDIRSIVTGADAATCINAASDASELEKVCSLDEKIKDFTDDLKGEFVLTLGFSVPNDAQGDND